MPLSRLLDPLAEALLNLRTVSPGQWLLRGAGLLGGAAALLLARGELVPSGLLGVLAAIIGAVRAVQARLGAALLVQLFVPDAASGPLVPLTVVLVAAADGDLTALRALGVGLCLLVSVAGTALAALVPAHGVVAASLWRPAGRALLVVLVVVAVGALAVLLVAPVVAGPWALVAGAVAVVGLLVLLLPRGER